MEEKIKAIIINAYNTGKTHCNHTTQIDPESYFDYWSGEITGLLREKVEKAMPEKKIIPHIGIENTVEGYDQALEDYHNNLLKAIGEK